MSYRDVDFPRSASFGDDEVSSLYDPYIPILNEPMGRQFTPLNFEPTDIKSNNAKLEEKEKNYEYIPLSYKTDSSSYLDSWQPIKESMSNLNLNPDLNLNTILLFVLLIIITYLLFQNYKKTKKLVKLLKVNNI